MRRVLIYRLGSLGDTLIALPALKLVARAFPDAERRLLTNFPVNVKGPRQLPSSITPASFMDSFATPREPGACLSSPISGGP